MKIVITLDPAIATSYALEKSDQFLVRMQNATETVIRRMDSDSSVFAKLLFNRPKAIVVEVEKT